MLAGLLRNPEEKAEAIVEDFVRRGFETSAVDMGRYFIRWKHVSAGSARDSPLRDIGSALRKAEPGPVRCRIELYGLYLNRPKLLQPIPATGRAMVRFLPERSTASFAEDLR